MSKSDTVTQSEFARMCGVSRQAVSKLVKSGEIGVFNKRVDLTHSGTRSYMVKREAAGPSNQPAATPPPVILHHGVKSLDDIDETNLFLLTKSDIDKFKAYESALDLRQKRDVARGHLVSRDIVRRVFSKLYTVDNNQLKTLEDRVTPAICGIFNRPDDSTEAVKIRKLLNRETAKALRHIKRIMNEYLVAADQEEI